MIFKCAPKTRNRENHLAIVLNLRSPPVPVSLGRKLFNVTYVGFLAILRRQNTRCKNPQLVAQHCFEFVASFGRCFAFFTLHDQLDPQQKHLLQVEEMQRSDWLICQSASKFVARQVVSLMKNEQQSQNLLHKVDPRSTFRNNSLRHATNVFVVRQVDYAR